MTDVERGEQRCTDCGHPRWIHGFSDGSCAERPTEGAACCACPRFSPPRETFTDEEIRARFAHRELSSAEVTAVQDLLAIAAAASPTDAPPPALGELARLATAAKEACPSWFPRPAAVVSCIADVPEDAAFIAACSPDAILALVALATGGAAGGQQQEQTHEGKTENGQPQAPQKSGRSVPRCTTTTPE